MCVVHGLSRSSWVPAPYGLPQGSVLGPLLYIIYTSDIASFLTSQAMLGQLYADDVQVYQHCPASDALVTVSAMSRTMEALGSWMSSNRLRLNPHKTQFIKLWQAFKNLTKPDLSPTDPSKVNDEDLNRHYAYISTDPQYSSPALRAPHCRMKAW